MSLAFAVLAMIAACAAVEQFDQHRIRVGSLLTGATVALLLASWSS